MGTHEDRLQLEAHIAELRDQLSTERLQLSPDARVTGLTAVVQSEALMLMADTLHSAPQTLVNDGMRPLMGQLRDR